MVDLRVTVMVLVKFVGGPFVGGVVGFKSRRPILGRPG